MKNQTIDMRCMRYLNLFEGITKVRTKNCFQYNNCLIFAVPQEFVSRAIGEQGRNVKKLVSILGKKIKIIAFPNTREGIWKFISDVVSPIEFKGLEVTQNEVIINAPRQSKASLIGRNKTRLMELKKIVEECFGKDLRII